MPNAWDAEQIVSVPLAKTLTETQFPELAPATISLLGYGFDNTVYQVTTALCSGFQDENSQ